MKRVVITGIGAVTPLGPDMAASWEGLLSGRSRLVPAKGLDGPGLTVVGRAEVDLEGRLGRKECMRYDRFVLLGALAADEAVADAGLHEADKESAGVVMGSSRGGISSLEAAVNSRASAFLMSGTTISMAASKISERMGARGHVLGISNACASGANAVGEAMRLIQEGRQGIVICGGAEAPLTPLCIRGYNASGALSRSGRMMPFGEGRDGFVLAEGAAVLVLEDLDRAITRGARVYAEVVGYGNTSDAHHPTEPLSAGQAAAISAAMAQAGLAPGGIDLISAHATSTLKGDKAEAEAMAGVMGKEVPRMMAIKALTGHMLAASGAFEVAATARAIRDGVIPEPVSIKGSLKGLDKGAGLVISPSMALCHSFGFGGVNAVLALRKH